MRPLACVVVLLASVLGSRGTDLAPSPAVANSPAAQGQTSSPPEPTFALRPVILPTAPPTPSASPPLQKGAVSPAVPTEPQNAPAPVIPPKEYNAPPPVESAPPALTDDVPPPAAPPPPVESAPPTLTDKVPPPAAPPQATVENPTPILPGSPALLPSVQAPTPSVAVKPNLPVAPPPSVNNQPSRPIGSGLAGQGKFC